MKPVYYFFFFAVLVHDFHFTPCVRKSIFAAARTPQHRESISPSHVSLFRMLMEKKEEGSKPSFSRAIPLTRPPSVKAAVPPEIKKETQYWRPRPTMAPLPLSKSRQTFFTNLISLPPQIGPNSCKPEC